MKKMTESKDLIVGLDIGTSKIVALVAEATPEGGLNIIGMGQSPSRGLKKGVVVNIEATVSAIQRALEEAELMANCKITHVYTGIALISGPGVVAGSALEFAFVYMPKRILNPARYLPIRKFYALIWRQSFCKCAR
jgi:Ethanolamine utilization protein EutJ (predicted chaperonin)